MIFDYSDGDFIMPLDDSMGMDSDGNLHMRMDDNLSMEMNSGDLHFTSPWNRTDDTYLNNEEDDDDNDFLGLGRFFRGLW